MAIVTLAIGGRRYDLACRDGEEDRLRRLAAMVDAKAADAGRAVGEANEARQLVMAALLLADDLAELRDREPDRQTEVVARTIDLLARRLETLAARLENDGGMP